MRTVHPNRQARRVGLCIRARQPASRDMPALARRGLALQAYGGDLAVLAESVADELELSPEEIERLLWPESCRP